MIYLVVENYYDLDSSWSKIIFATEDRKLAETIKIENLDKHNKEKEKFKKISDSLKDKDFEDFTEEDNRLYDELMNFENNSWASTNIKEIDIDTDVNVYI